MARAKPSESSSFEFRYWKMGDAQWMIHSLATHIRHDIAGPLIGGSSRASLSCQIGRFIQGAKPVLVRRAINELRFFHCEKSWLRLSLISSPSNVGSSVLSVKVTLADKNVGLVPFHCSLTHIPRHGRSFHIPVL